MSLPSLVGLRAGAWFLPREQIVDKIGVEARHIQERFDGVHVAIQRAVYVRR